MRGRHAAATYLLSTAATSCHFLVGHVLGDLTNTEGDWGNSMKSSNEIRLAEAISRLTYASDIVRHPIAA